MIYKKRLKDFKLVYLFPNSLSIGTLINKFGSAMTKLSSFQKQLEKKIKQNLMNTSVKIDGYSLIIIIIIGFLN